jgi:hypothetical protein
MSDPITTHAAQAADTLQGQARDARVEHLLLAGLDCYFAGQYEQAIHIWTRVLFLDRGHARARAYIERARSAAGERQREADELLHRGTAAFDHGENASARRLLTAAIERGAAPDVPLAYLGRLDRLDPLPAPTDPAARRPPALADAAGRKVEKADRRSWWHIAATISVLVTGMLCAAWLVGAIADLSGFGADARHAPTLAAVAEPLLIPRASDLALARARALFGKGNARDALQLIATVPDDDPNRADADRLLADIQRTLLATADPAIADAMGTVR